LRFAQIRGQTLARGGSAQRLAGGISGARQTRGHLSEADGASCRERGDGASCRAAVGERGPRAANRADSNVAGERVGGIALHRHSSERRALGGPTG